MPEENNDKLLVNLARKILNGKATEEEKLFLEEYYNAFDSHADIRDALSETEIERLKDTIYNNIDQQINQAAPPRIGRFRKWQWAAAVILIVTGFSYFYSKLSREQHSFQTVVSPDFLPGTNRATLTLENGDIILLDTANNGSIATQGGITVLKTEDGKLQYAVAKNSEHSSAVNINTISTPRGGQYQVTLPDGTAVWLNASSSITFPTRFTGTFREVTLSGEAYFEVARDKQHPFIVTNGLVKTEVLGTSFNIMAYANEATAKTTLIEGSVQIRTNGQKALLKPGQQLLYNTAQFEILNNANVEEALAWKNGIFYFNNATVEDVMRCAERWYDIDVKFEGKIPEKQFTGKLSRNVSLLELLDILSFTDINYSIQGRKLTIKE